MCDATRERFEGGEEEEEEEEADKMEEVRVRVSEVKPCKRCGDVVSDFSDAMIYAMICRKWKREWMCGTEDKVGKERETRPRRTVWKGRQGRAGEEGQARAHAGKKQKAGRKVQKGSCWGWGMLGNVTLTGCGIGRGHL